MTDLLDRIDFLSPTSHTPHAAPLQADEPGETRGWLSRSDRYSLHNPWLMAVDEEDDFEDDDEFDDDEEDDLEDDDDFDDDEDDEDDDFFDDDEDDD